MKIILSAGARPVSIVATKTADDRLDELAEKLAGRWKDLSGLSGAAVHLGLAGNELFELMWWEPGIEPQAALNVYRDQALRDFTVIGAESVLMTPGPDYHTGQFSVTIDAGIVQPVLLSIMHCSIDRQPALLDYLMASAERFRGAFGGWIGAALLPAADGTAVAEYLQFESPEAMMALAGLPIVEEHKCNLLAYGEMRACVARPVACWSRASEIGGAM